MSLIDWSDPDEMFGLLTEYVADEASACHADRDRAAFLRALTRELNGVAGRASGEAGPIARALRRVRDALPQEFMSDPVMSHLDACIEELDRIVGLRQA